MRIAIRMILESEFSIGLLYLVEGGVLGNTKDLVRVETDHLGGVCADEVDQAAGDEDGGDE